MGACCSNGAIQLKTKDTSTAAVSTNIYNLPMKFIKLDGKCSLELKQKVMKTKPEVGVLCLLDIILDYLAIEDLERLVCVNKFFCYVATLDRLFVKFHIFEDDFEIDTSNPKTKTGGVLHKKSDNTVPTRRDSDEPTNRESEENRNIARSIIQQDIYYNISLDDNSIVKSSPFSENRQKKISGRGVKGSIFVGDLANSQFSQQSPIAIKDKLRCLRNLMNEISLQSRERFRDTLVMNEDFTEGVDDIEVYDTCLKTIESRELLPHRYTIKMQKASQDGIYSFHHVKKASSGTLPQESLQKKRISKVVHLKGIDEDYSNKVYKCMANAYRKTIFIPSAQLGSIQESSNEETEFLKTNRSKHPCYKSSTLLVSATGRVEEGIY